MDADQSIRPGAAPTLSHPLAVAPAAGRVCQTPRLTELMLKSGTRSAGAAARVK